MATSKQQSSETRQKAEEAAKAVTDTSSTSSGKAPEQTPQEAPNPELQAALTDPATDRQEQHVVDENPDDADRRTAEAPGIRSEAEIIADHQADNERAAEALAANAHTADPAASTSAVKLPRVRVEDRLVHYRREDGTVQSVNEGTPEHRQLIRSGWEKVSASEAKKFEPRTFPRVGTERGRARR